MSQSLSSFFSSMDVNHLVINKIAILSVILLFFLAVHAVNAFTRKGLPASKVKSTIKIAILGLLLLALESRIGAHPLYGDFISRLQTLIVMLCLANLVAYLIVDAYLYYKMGKHVPSFLRDLLLLLVYVAFAMTSLRVVFHIDVSSILTTTTVLTAAVAFAMQTTIANVISGFYIQNDRNLRNKTWISIKDKDVVGEIVNVGFRYTTIRTLDDQQVMVPNSYILQNIVHSLGNGKESERSAVNLRVILGYDLPPEKAVGLMSDVLLEEKQIAKNPAPLITVYNFLDNGIEYNLRYHLEEYPAILSTRGSVLNKIWYAVTREGHSFPYPHRELIAKTPRNPFPPDGAAILSILKRTEIFGSLGEEEYAKLAERARVKVYGTGEVVVRQGDVGGSLFLVKGGTLNVSVDNALVGRLGEGDIFGEMSLLTGEKRNATVAAAQEVWLIEISKEDIEPLIKEDPRILDRLSTILAEREEKNIEHRRSRELSPSGPDRKEAFLRKLKAFFDL